MQGEEAKTNGLGLYVNSVKALKDPTPGDDRPKSKRSLSTGVLTEDHVAALAAAIVLRTRGT